MYIDLEMFLYGTAFGAGVSFLACFLACVAYSRMSGHPSPTGVVHMPAMQEPLPFYLKDDRAEATIERSLLGRDTVEGLGR